MPTFDSDGENHLVSMEGCGGLRADGCASALWKSEIAGSGRASIRSKQTAKALGLFDLGIDVWGTLARGFKILRAVCH